MIALICKHKYLHSCSIYYTCQFHAAGTQRIMCRFMHSELHIAETWYTYTFWHMALKERRLVMKTKARIKPYFSYMSHWDILLDLCTCTLKLGVECTITVNVKINKFPKCIHLRLLAVVLITRLLLFIAQIMHVNRCSRRTRSLVYATHYA